MVVFEFTFDDAFVSETYARFQRTHTMSYVRPSLRALIVLLVAPISIFDAVYLHKYWAWVTLLVVPWAFFPGALTRWTVVRRLRKSPGRNEKWRIGLENDVIHSISDSVDGRIKWSAFTEVRRFPDGLLLMRGPYLFQWLPLRFLTSGSAAELDELVRAKIAPWRQKRRPASWPRRSPRS